MNFPKFLEMDLPLFEGIISDLFPGRTRPVLDYGALNSVMKLVIQAKGLQPHPFFTTKVGRGGLFSVERTQHSVERRTLLTKPEAVFGVRFGSYEPGRPQPWKACFCSHGHDAGSLSRTKALGTILYLTAAVHPLLPPGSPRRTRPLLVRRISR